MNLIIHYTILIAASYIVGRYIAKEYLITFWKEILEAGPKTSKILTCISYIPVINLMATILFFILVGIISGIFYSVHYILKFLKSGF